VPSDASTHHRKRRHRRGDVLDRLLQAGLYMIERHGLGACTVERVAAEASLSQGSVYRRFNSEDAFLAAIFLHYLEQQNRIPPEQLLVLLKRPTLEETAERIVASIVERYRRSPQVHRAMAKFFESHYGTLYTDEAGDLLAVHYRQMADVLLRHSDRICHTDPTHAAYIAVLGAVAAIEDLFLEPDSVWGAKAGLPRSDRMLIGERTRAMIAYLRGQPEVGPPIEYGKL
jgi:AcrR family transcriptional regulator